MDDGQDSTNINQSVSIYMTIIHLNQFELLSAAVNCLIKPSKQRLQQT